MRYGYFISYNIFGGILWDGPVHCGGTFLGMCRLCRKTSPCVIAIVLISVVPAS